MRTIDKLAIDISRTIAKVTPPAIVVVGPGEWAALRRHAVNTDEGATFAGLPVYGQRRGGWHVMHVVAGMPMDGLERLYLWRTAPSDDDRTKLINDLSAAEHKYRNAVEGEYTAELLKRARLALTEEMTL